MSDESPAPARPLSVRERIALMNKGIDPDAPPSGVASPSQADKKAQPPVQTTPGRPEKKVDDAPVSQLSLMCHAARQYDHLQRIDEVSPRRSGPDESLQPGILQYSTIPSLGKGNSRLTPLSTQPHGESKSSSSSDASSAPKTPGGSLRKSVVLSPTKATDPEVPGSLRKSVVLSPTKAADPEVPVPGIARQRSASRGGGNPTEPPLPDAKDKDAPTPSEPPSSGLSIKDRIARLSQTTGTTDEADAKGGGSKPTGGSAFHPPTQLHTPGAGTGGAKRVSLCPATATAPATTAADATGQPVSGSHPRAPSGNIQDKIAQLQQQHEPATPTASSGVDLARAMVGHKPDTATNDEVRDILPRWIHSRYVIQSTLRA
jgi:hypothetical protein